MQVNLIAFAIPLFFVFIGLELWVARRRHQRVYRFADALSNLSCGISQQVIGLLTKGALIAGYAFCYERYRLFDLEPGSVLTWVIAFVGIDFLYYWWHRLSHRVNFLWAAHIVHHQSEDYNFSVALRQSVTTGSTTFFFYLVLAFLGVPPLEMVTALTLSTLYQFWIHTEVVGKVGFLEYFLNTPSHHRVHHAINPRYLDRNFAATFMLWDQLFGTFVVEDERPRYGITHALRSFNPLWAQVHYWVELARASIKTPRLVDKLRVWIASPTWQVPGVEPSSAPAGETKYDVDESPAGLYFYVVGHFVLLSGAIFLTLLRESELSLAVLAIITALVLLSLTAWGGLLEKKPWAPPLEAARLAMAGGLGVAALWGRPLLPAVGGLILAAGFTAWAVLRPNALALRR
jgi:alkylglycerol monooxygenase